MHIEFSDETTLEVLSINKSYDFKTTATILNVEFAKTVAEDDVMEKDFTNFKVVRNGPDDIEFEGCEPITLRVDINQDSTILNVDLRISGQ